MLWSYNFTQLAHVELVFRRGFFVIAAISIIQWKLLIHDFNFHSLSWCILYTSVSILASATMLVLPQRNVLTTKAQKV